MKKGKRKERARAEQERLRARSRTRREPTEEEISFRHLQQVNTAKWNRYMLIRYLDSGVFFVGLYWAVMLFALGGSPVALIAPAAELAVGACVLIEVNRVLTSDVEYLKVSHRALIVSLVLSGIEAIVTVAVGQDALFPFFSTPVAGVALIAILIALKAVIAWRIVLVRDRRDKKRYDLYLMALENAHTRKGR